MATITLTNEQLGGDIILTDAPRGVLSYPLRLSSRGAASVTETIRLYFDSGLQAAVQGGGLLRQIGQYFLEARLRQEQQSGDRIWLKLDPIDDGDVWRSEILDGSIVFPDDAMAGHHLPSDHGEVALIITRRAFWEKDQEFEMPLSIGGTYATGGRDIVNHADTELGDMNWVAWADWSVLGDLPAPLRVEFENTDASLAVRRLHMAMTHKVHDATNYGLLWTLEGEANDHNPGTSTADTNSSGDAYMVEQWTGTGETLVFTWDVTRVEFAGGNPFRILARFVNNNYDDLYARIVLRGNGSTNSEIWRGPLVKVGWRAAGAEELSDLGMIPALPPGLPDGIQIGTVYLDLYFLRNAAGTHTVNLDYLYPAPMDGGYRVVDSAATNITIGDTDKLIDDGIYERTYRVDATLNYSIGWRGSGKFLEAQPGKAGRLTLLWQSQTGSARTNATATVRLYYRARRVTL